MREPDWEALADVQFVLYNRVANLLNEALSGIALSDMPEASDHPPGYWKERATTRVLNVLNLFTAWTWLIRFKMGEPIPERAVRPFHTNDLLRWIGAQLQFSPPPTTTLNPLLRANQETLQEALLLLYSVAYTQGSGVRLVCEAATLGTWFRIRFDRNKPLPASIDALIAGFGEHWRARDALFELTTARDFVRLNGCELLLVSTAEYGEFAFFVPATVGKRRTGHLPSDSAVKTAQPAAPRPPASVPTTSQPAAPLPDIAVAQSSSETPVIRESSAPPEPIAPPPTLAILRPLPPQMLRAAPPPAAEGQAPPREPDEPETTAGESAALSAVTSPPAAGSPGDAPRPAAVIVRARIPEPRLPDRLRTPPASTSNVALTRETQTLTPVARQDQPPDVPAARDSEAPVPPPSAPGAPSDDQQEHGT